MEYTEEQLLVLIERRDTHELYYRRKLSALIQQEAEGGK